MNLTMRAKQIQDRIGILAIQPWTYYVWLVLITSLIVVVSPGTGVLFTLATGLSRGARASVIAAFGCTLGIVPHMAAAITGLAALLHASAVAFEVLRYLGVVYLLYMAWATLRERGAMRIEDGGSPRSALQITVTAILISTSTYDRNEALCSAGSIQALRASSDRNEPVYSRSVSRDRGHMRWRNTSRHR